MSKRVIYRGKSYIFKQSFLDKNGNPLEPADDTYPRYSIYDINNSEVEVGTGKPSNKPGWYAIDFVAPDNALLSTDDCSWRIEWLFVDKEGNHYLKVEDFDLVDETISAADEISQQFIFLANKDNKLIIRLFSEPFLIRLTIYDEAGSPTSVENVEHPGNKIDKIRDGDSYLYSYTIRAGTFEEGQTYSAMWEIYENPDSTPDYIWQKIVAVHWKVLRLIPDLRMLIDKIQKKQGTVQAYSDADLTNYIEQGLRMLNGWHPVTSYTYSTLPDQLFIFLLLFSAWYALNSQYMLEVDSAFSFGGQTVTLDYDRTGGIESEIGRLMEFITEHLTRAKTAVLRGRSLGIVSVRPYRGCQPVVRWATSGVGMNLSLTKQLASIFDWY